ncbi:hypothetical protein BTJ40_06255 [Microbulbifer sp. A4B17]|uniref:hypothetical protein n=1 Tax=Microbulbifer sp. A4B17 TaxID=359370 RepID=UPI000D52C661|nr:hypothetical protein [Microbulbifer sp. A4B17]AWF80445.1 hypothetical protein BTJ40_06255 [Microbulbifer sp. A4B17]
MIKYRFEEEKDIILHYANFLNDQKTSLIISKGMVSDRGEAFYLAKFFWSMVDLSVEDIEEGRLVCGYKDLAAWNEYIMNSLRSYLRSSGYADEWERATDQS